MRALKSGPQVEKDFERFVMENCGAPDGGTASSYRRAMELLKDVFALQRPAFAATADVWSITDPAEIMRLYAAVKKEQDKFKAGRGGVFGPYVGRGDSYYRKGWCSAALKFFAQFRAANGYAAKFDAALKSSADGAEVAKTASCVKLGNLAWCVPEGVDPASREGREAIRQTKTRIGQRVFRRWILGIYGGKCCVTGLDILSVLEASHISDWDEDKANRMNPSNGLCLSATYHKAFDAHLISFDDNYRMVLSKSLKDHCTAQVHRDYFLNFEGDQITKPSKFLPDVKLLAKHREKLVT